MAERNRTAVGAAAKECTQRQWSPVKTENGGGVAKKRGALRSVRFRTWTYFFLLAALTLFILWLFQLLFFKSAYRAMKRQEIEKIGAAIEEKYPGNAGDEAYDLYLHKTAMKNGLNVIVFRAKEAFEGCSAQDVTFAAEYVSSQFNAGELIHQGLIPINDARIINDWGKFYTELRQRPQISYFTEINGGSYLVYGAQMDNGSCLYLAGACVPIDSTISVMTDQLILATVVCLVLSVMISWIISDRITKPVTEFSQVARRLARGDYSVRFTGNGYTELEDLADTLNYATEEIGKTEQMRRDFLANVGHDLRTPLTMVKAYAEMIRDISGSDEIKRTQHSQVIIDEADRLTGLVNDILHLSKLQSGIEALQNGDVDLGTLARIVLERFDVYAERDGYVFRFSSEGECTAYGDRKRLEQVIYNLVGNAVSHTGENKTVLTHVKGDDDKVRVSVRDFGAGIAEEDLDKIWERYYRANQSKRNVVGSGLGLSIVKSILTAHDATYGVSSRVGEGTEIWFELPKRPKEEQTPRPLPEHTEKIDK